MRAKQIIISFFLLFVYSISFAHSLSFHEHGFYAEHQYGFIEGNGAEHHHQHHSHDNSSHKDTHINHNDHCDEGVIDLIVCVLSDFTNHQHNDCHFEHQFNSESKRIVNQPNLEFSAIFSASYFFQFKNYSNLKPSTNQLNKDFLCPLIDSQSQRGPPFLS